MALDIHSGSVLHSAARDEVCLVICRPASVGAWQCFTLDPRVHGWIRTIYISDGELNGTSDPEWEVVGHIACRDPMVWTDILKKGASSLKTLRVITNHAKERLYNNEAEHKPKRLLKGSLIFQEEL